MTVSRPKPKPIRLTRKRALALLDAAEIGIETWEFEVRADIQTTDLTQMREAQQLDLTRAAAIDAMAIIRHRYAGGDVPEQPTPTLFD